MIDVQVKEDDPAALEELIESTLHGHIPPNPSSPATEVGRLVREQQEAAERGRPSRQELPTVNFAMIELENDWSDL